MKEMKAENSVTVREFWPWPATNRLYYMAGISNCGKFLNLILIIKRVYNFLPDEVKRVSIELFKNNFQERHFLHFM